MPKYSSIFKTPEDEAKYMAAYDAVLALWPVPHESFDMLTRFGKTHIIASGPKEAPPLVLLHATSASATMWFPNITDLSREYRTYALDTLGEPGKSVVSNQPQKRSDYALWLTDVFNELNVIQADVVGASYGGWVTMNLALSSPEKVKKIVLLSPPAAFVPFNKIYVLRIIPSMLIPIRFFINNSIRPLFVKRPIEVYFEQLVLAAKCKFKEVFPTEFTDDELRQIKTPTLLLIGEKEVILSASKAMDRAKRLVPDIQAEMIPEASHMLSMEKIWSAEIAMSFILAGRINYWQGCAFGGITVLLLLVKSIFFPSRSDLMQDRERVELFAWLSGVWKIVFIQVNGTQMTRIARINTDFGFLHLIFPFFH